MEMLVTLVIVSFTAVLLSQALFQAARVERLLDGETLGNQNVALRVQWLRQTLESIVPLDASQADSFRGNSRLLEGMSTQVPGWPDSVTSAFSLELIDDSKESRTRLVLWLGTGARDASRRQIAVLTWPGARGEIRYLAADGAWGDVWPPAGLKPGSPRIPEAVAITTDSLEFPLIIVGPLTSGVPRITRAQFEAL